VSGSGNDSVRSASAGGRPGGRLSCSQGAAGTWSGRSEWGKRTIEFKVDGWMEFISPGGTEPKGPWHAKYIQFVRFCRGLAQALELSLSAKLPNTSCLMGNGSQAAPSHAVRTARDQVSFPQHHNRHAATPCTGRSTAGFSSGSILARSQNCDVGPEPGAVAEWGLRTGPRRDGAIV
jgi:hypothetical protein